jgi:hypothetical protein
MSLQFIPELHKYVSIDGSEITWTSVTNFISKFKQPFDADSIAMKVSRSKKSKWYGMNSDDIKEAWKNEAKRATDLGTWYHNEREADICGLETIGREGINIPVYAPNLNIDGTKNAPDQKLTEGIYPEHMIYLKSVGLCGQSDYVEVVNKKVKIIDFKTNKEIKKESFKDYTGKSQKMFAPVSHLDDCNFNHYALQLSMYMYMIIKHNPLYKPGEMKLHHIIFDEAGKDKYGNPISALDERGNPIVKEIIQYDVPYLKQEVISLINYKKENQNG